MSTIVKPVAGMVPVYDFYKAQDYYYRKILERRDAQVAIAPEFTFEVTKNKSETYIASKTKRGLVNVLIGPVEPANRTTLGKNHVTKLLFELYWNSKDDNSGSKLQADELALEYLYYLSATVEFALTSVYNQVPDNLTYGAASLGDIALNFSRPEKIGESESVWGLGKLELGITTAYNYDELTQPNLELAEVNLGNDIVPIFEPNPAP